MLNKLITSIALALVLGISTMAFAVPGPDAHRRTREAFGDPHEFDEKMSEFVRKVVPSVAKEIAKDIVHYDAIKRGVDNATADNK